MTDLDSEHQLEAAISRLLRAGVAICATFLAVGWTLSASGYPAGRMCMAAGIRVLMATPILRVVATFVLFLKQRDHVYVVITAIVLVILTIGLVGGIEL